MPGGSPTSLLHVSKEVRVDLEPDVPHSVIEFQTPSPAITFSRASRPKRQILKALPIYSSENDFARSNVASSSSVYFGRSGRYPRCFLWRLLEDNKVLEIRSVDLSKSDQEADEALYILRFYFPSAIRESGVALADVEDQNNLDVFALTTSNDLYTLDLKTSFFRHASASEEDIEDWCKVFKPASTSFSTAHQIIAISSLELFIALSDGRILHLTRPSGVDGASWHELACNDGQWGSSLRSLVRWQGSNTVRYGNATLDQDTVQTMAYSPDRKHLWMVCLNHTLKVRNMKLGKTVFTIDLLGTPREPHEISKLLLDPSNFNMLQVFEIPDFLQGDQYYLMTFSPHDLGQFKVWAVRDADSGEKGIRDFFPDATFLPPDPDPNPDSKTIWKVADFKVRVAETQTINFLCISILMRSNRRYKLYSLKLACSALKTSMVSAWQTDWTVAASEFVDQEAQPHATDVEPEGVIDKWLDFLLKPGKYPQPVIQTALSVYASTKKSTTSISPKASVKEQIPAAISRQVALSRVDSNGMDFDGYRAALEEEFLDLWQEIRDLDALRWDNASLVYDIERQIPWLVFADGCSPVRECSHIEIIAHNTQDVLEGLPEKTDRHPDIPVFGLEGESVLPNELAVLVAAATTFRQSFSHELLHACNTTLASELWQDPVGEASLRIQSFYEQCEFDTEIENDAFTRLVSQLGPIGGIGGLRNAHFNAITNCLLNSMPKEASGLRSTKFGLKVLVRGAQEMPALSWQMLYDLLLLAIVVETEVDRDDDPMDDFDAAELLPDILDMLKNFQVAQWLTTNLRPEPSETGTGTSAQSQSRTSTVIENLFALDLSPRPYKDQSEAVALTETIQDVLVWALGFDEEDLDDVLVRIQCNLLANDNFDLACDFLQYQPSTPWATYIKGRFYLLKGEFTEAAMHFENASSAISLPGLHSDPATSDSLLSEAEAARLGRGPTAYFSHIQDLFQSAACPSYVGTFAHKILERNLPLSQQIMPLTRLFHASISVLDFDSAFSVLTRLPSDKSSTLLPAFLTALLAENEFNRTLDLPWPPKLLPHVESYLSQKASKTPTTSFYHPSTPQYNKYLAAWRIKRLDYRGAAAALLSHLQRIQKLHRSSSMGGEDDEIIATYLGVINLLSCCGDKDEAWVLTDAFEEVGPKASKGEQKDEVKKRRRLITIQDVRARYEKELDRRSQLESGKWDFGLDGAGDEHEEDGTNVDEEDEEN